MQIWKEEKKEPIRGLLGHFEKRSKHVEFFCTFVDGREAEIADTAANIEKMGRRSPWVVCFIILRREKSRHCISG